MRAFHTEGVGNQEVAKNRGLAARIGAVFEESLVIDEQTVDLGASVGVAIHPDHAAHADSLMSRAEVAMYTAKRRTAGAMLYNRAAAGARHDELRLQRDEACGGCVGRSDLYLGRLRCHLDVA